MTITKEISFILLYASVMASVVQKLQVISYLNMCLDGKYTHNSKRLPLLIYVILTKRKLHYYYYPLLT